MKHLIFEQRKNSIALMEIDFLEIKEGDVFYLFVHRQCGGMFLSYPWEVRYPDAWIHYVDERGNRGKCRQSQAAAHNIRVVKCRYCGKVYTQDAQVSLVFYHPERLWPGRPLGDAHSPFFETRGPHTADVVTVRERLAWEKQQSILWGLCWGYGRVKTNEDLLPRLVRAFRSSAMNWTDNDIAAEIRKTIDDMPAPLKLKEWKLKLQPFRERLKIAPVKPAELRA